MPIVKHNGKRRIEGTTNINFPDESDFEDGYEKGYNQAFSDIDKFLKKRLYESETLGIISYKFFYFEWDDFKKEKLGDEK